MTERITIRLGGDLIAETHNAMRVLETSHPPVYYVPIADFVDGALTDAVGSSFCEFKGAARYLDVHGGGMVAAGAAWNYPHPTRGFEVLEDRVAVYAAPMDECTVGGEVVAPATGRLLRRLGDVVRRRALQGRARLHGLVARSLSQNERRFA